MNTYNHSVFNFIKQIRNKPTLLLLFILLIFGLWLRYENNKGNNAVFDYDQNEDMFYTYKLAVDHQPVIIGRAVYGDPRLHQGVFFYYYNLIPFLISKGSFLASIYWNIFFNTATLVIVFALGKSVFRKTLPAILSALLVAASSEFIRFSNWITIDTVAIFLIPLFYLGLWEYYQKKKWGLVLSAAALGLSIQTDLSLVYLIPVLVIYWAIFRPKVPGLKLAFLSFLTLLVTTCTMTLTEFKLNFIGIKTMLNFSSTFTDTQLPFSDRLQLFFRDFGINFANNLFPGRKDLGIYIAGAIVLTAIYFLSRKKTLKAEKYGIYFLLLYLFSPIVTLLFGYHQKPWFLIGLPPAIALITGYAISKLKYFFFIPVILVIIFGNISFIQSRPQKAYGQFDLIYDSTSYLNYQLAVIDYTYQSSGRAPFAVNAVTYPLYYNGMWAYLYSWYGKVHYGYLPGWLGGDQLHPYDLLPKAKGEKYFYILISETIRIPEVFKNKGRAWGAEHGKLIEEKQFPGFTVQKYITGVDR